MELRDAEILFGNDVREAVEANLERDPLKVALDRSVPHASLVATQVKYLQRARRKLPSYFAARCVIPSLAFEQSSGEQAARHKCSGLEGDLCIDLTCGLGVDAFHFSRVFRHVTAIERDPALAHTARGNFRLLGAENIEVLGGTAEDFIERLTAEQGRAKADLIYLDPARRSASGRKVAALSDCSPDALSMMPTLLECARKVMLKLSPMFDVGEVFRLFGPAVDVEVVSADGECKEVLVTKGESVESPVIRVSVVGSGSVEYDYAESLRSENILNDRDMNISREGDSEILIAPDPAMVKARVAAKYFRENGACIESDNSFAFYARGARLPDFLPGTAYRITAIEDYDPTRIRKSLKKSGIARLNILCRNFPETAPQIAARIGVKEGGAGFAAFTRLGGRLRMISLAALR